MTNPSDGQYAKGVDSRKGGFGRLFTSVDAELFPHAFCKIYVDPLTGVAYTKKPDGVGSKSVQRYVHWKVTGDASVFEGDADDCFVMNAGDVSCAGLLHRWIYTDSIAINQLYVDKGAYIEAINRGMKRIKDMYKEHGLPFVFPGGETADLVDQARTVIFEGDIYAEAPRDLIVTCERIAPGDAIMGVRSGGPCKLEKGPNSGIMSNGITSARHVLFVPDYAEEYPEIADPRGDPYTGNYRIGDMPAGLGMEISEAVMSPTRHFPLIIKRLLEELGPEIHGLVLNTGGGQTKCTRVGNGIRYVKDNLPEPDPVFMLLQDASGKPWKKMHESFNMGIGLDVIVPDSACGSVRRVAEEFGVGCQQTGVCEKSDDFRNKLLIRGEFGEFLYDAE